MERWNDRTLADVARSLGRYRYFVVFVAGILVLGILAPGSRLADTGSSLSQSGVGGTGATARAGDAASNAGGGSPAASTGGTASRVQSAGGGAAAGAGAANEDLSGPPPAVLSAGAADPMAAADCDQATARIQVPSVYSPPCVPEWPEGADNGGATAQGVTADEIVIAIRFNPDPDPAGQAILLAAGIDDTQEEARATRDGYVDYFQHHYRTYGRTVKLVYFEQSGEDDDEADRADALRVATEIKAFASWGGTGAYRDELVARGVLCIACGTSEPIETYLDYAPYVWGTLMASSQAYIHRAEYIGKRLWGREASHAGDPAYQLQQRRLAIVYFETEEGSYKQGVDFFEEELTKYGARLTDRISYLGDLATAQEQSRVIIARLKDRDITSVIFAGDPIAPAFLTQEATNQNYRPEWIITGSALTDTSLFARTYDQSQWQHAFGVSMLAARAPNTVLDPWRLYEWHHGEGPPADDSYSVIYPTPWIFYTGVHLAGPNLTVESFRDGLFSYPVSAVGMVTNVQTSFGHHGIWPWADYLAYDDMTEIWWDPTTVGPDETGKEAPGLYWYVDGGKRYGAGDWPASDAAPFVRDGAVTVYDELPAGDTPPHYEHQPHG
jgi:hypothetical protein